MSAKEKTSMRSVVKDLEHTSIHDGLLAVELAEESKEMIYRHYRNEIFGICGFKVTGHADAEAYKKSYQVAISTLPGGNLQAFLITQFPEWPRVEITVDDKKVNQAVAWNEVQNRIQAGKNPAKYPSITEANRITDVKVVRAFAAINRFKVWVSMIGAQDIKELHDVAFQAEAAKRAAAKMAAKETEKGELTDKDKARIMEQAKGEVRKEMRPSNPRLLDGKGNANIPMLKNMDTAKLMEVEKGLAKENPELVRRALEEATGQAVIMAKTIADLPVSSLAPAIKALIAKCKQPTKAQKLWDELMVVLAEESTITPAPENKKGRGKVKPATA